MENEESKNVTEEMTSSPRSTRASARKRQSQRRIKNLEEEEVVSILSQDDSDDYERVEAPSENTAIISTPTRKRRAPKEAPQTPRSTAIAAEHLQTPRRSVRKSIKPAQDYEDIVANKTTRSVKKGEKPSSLEEIDEGTGTDHVEAPKWTPAKVGRVSQKRKTRKKKNSEAKHKVHKDQEILVDGEVLDVIADDEDENKENVEPRDLNRNRKLPKDSDTKIIKRRSLDTIRISDSAKRNSQKLNVSDPGLTNFDIASSSATTDVVIGNIDEEIKNSKSKEEVLNNKIQKEESELGEMSELGLKPLQLDKSTTDEKQEAVKVPENVANVDEKKAATINNDTEECQESPANATFDTSDCIIISPECSKQSLEKNDSQKIDVNRVENCHAEVGEDDCMMQSLLISDDDEDNDVSEPAAKIPKIRVTNEENLLQTINSSPLSTTRKEITKKNTSSVVTIQANTPKNSSKPFRFPTPYKNEGKIFKFNENKNLEDEPPVEIKLTTLEPKEIVLRSIRKRSLSACIDRSQNKHTNRVTFHSPANQTAFIEELDVLIAKSTKKSNNPNARKRCEDAPDNNITKRRKRSLSVDETAMQARHRVKAAPLTPNKGTPLKVQPRTKIPNFAAIHQRQFNQMENLVDHVTRKAERAKVLTNSAHKIRIASAQKGAPPVKNLNNESAGGAGATAGQITKVVKSRAVKKIELSEITMKPKPMESTTSDDENIMQNDVCNLPNPRLIKIISTSQPKKTSKPAPPRNVFKPTQQIQPIEQHAKPAFNLSTHVDTHKANTSIMCKPMQATGSAAGAVSRSLSDKVAERRQRHMDMFKGRVRGRRDQENSGEIIRGVRSNRRFDLQMLHRKNLANQTD